MPSRAWSVSYAPNVRAVPSVAASWAPLGERIHALHNASSTETSGALTDQQNVAIRRALIELFRSIGGEDAALKDGKTAFASFSVSSTAATLFVNLT